MGRRTARFIRVGYKLHPVRWEILLRNVCEIAFLAAAIQVRGGVGQGDQHWPYRPYRPRHHDGESRAELVKGAAGYGKELMKTREKERGQSFIKA